MLVSQQAKKSQNKEQLDFEAKTENSPEQNKLSSCFREENSCKSIFHSHSQLQFRQFCTTVSFSSFSFPSLKDLYLEKENKASTISKEGVDVWNITEHYWFRKHLLSTYYTTTVQGTRNTHINVQRTSLFIGVPCV